jgi:FixJ family two-component response regulator
MIQPETSAEAPVVYVIDDDAAMREALSSLFRSIGLQVQVFSSAPDFLPGSKPAATGSPACAGVDNDGIQALAVGH